MFECLYCKLYSSHLPETQARINAMMVLTNISLIKCPGLSRMINPTTMPAKIDTTVSWIARIRLICR
jgi:hypothetical protein